MQWRWRGPRALPGAWYVNAAAPVVPPRPPLLDSQGRGRHCGKPFRWFPATRICSVFDQRPLWAPMGLWVVGAARTGSALSLLCRALPTAHAPPPEALASGLCPCPTAFRCRCARGLPGQCVGPVE